MRTPKLEASLPGGYKFGNSSGTCTKLNGLVNPLSTPRTAGVLTVILIIAGKRNQGGTGRGLAISPSNTQCHASGSQSLDGSSSKKSFGGYRYPSPCAFASTITI